MSEHFYITTPIYYANARPHIGHTYTTVIADVLARYHKLCGEQVFFLTGTDEHGDKMAETAGKLGVEVKSLADENSARFRALWPQMHVENDRFIRTTDPEHMETVQGILQKVYDQGDIYFGEYGGNYCTGCERFLTDSELVDGKCPQHDIEPVFMEEKNYFFRMEKYRSWLVEYINEHPDFIRPERYRNEVLGMLREPLDDLCISRPKSRLTWGIDLPFDHDFVCYVWFDALINYLTGIGYPDGENFDVYWSKAQHLIAKDILKPHAVYWPTMIKAMGLEPYSHLNVHGYWNVDQAKMSKSLGNVLDPMELKEKYGVEAFRYFLVRDMVFGLDANFSEESMVERYNSDLANDLGNLVSRSTRMVSKYFDGVLPEPPQTLGDADRELRNAAAESVRVYREKMEGVELHNAMMATWSLISALNKYIDHSKPWVLAKEDKERLAAVMYHVIEGIRYVAVMITPVMPETSATILAVLGAGDQGGLATLESFGQLAGGITVQTPKALFPRVEKKKDTPIEKESPATNPAIEDDNLIDIKEFAKVEIAVGRITAAEKVKKSDKLLKLQVDVGRPVQVAAGLAKVYAPEELVGKQVAVVINLKPAKLMGIESQGMLLATDTADGGLTLLGFDREPKTGARIR